MCILTWPECLVYYVYGHSSKEELERLEIMKLLSPTFKKMAHEAEKYKEQFEKNNVQFDSAAAWDKLVKENGEFWAKD